MSMNENAPVPIKENTVSLRLDQARDLREVLWTIAEQLGISGDIEVQGDEISTEPTDYADAAAMRLEMLGVTLADCRQATIEIGRCVGALRLLLS